MVDYFENPALSQSKLKLLLGDPRLFNTVEEPRLYFEEKEHFVLGDALDVRLTQMDKFDDLFYIAEQESKPSDKMMSILHMIFDTVVQEEIPSFIKDPKDIAVLDYAPYRRYILKALNEHMYQPKWKEDTRVEKVCKGEGHAAYWESLKLSYGKTILTQEENTIVSSMEMAMKTSPFTEEYFKTTKDEEIFYQFPIYFEYKGEECKALLDLVKFNHRTKSIQPVDIKSMGDYTFKFPISLRKRRYDIQGAFYTEALEAYIKQNPELEDYHILPFKFIVDSTIDPGNPLVFTLTDELLKIGKSGRPALTQRFDMLGIDNNVIPSELYLTSREELLGFDQLIDLYKAYQRSGFEQRTIVTQCNGDFLLDWEGIVHTN